MRERRFIQFRVWNIYRSSGGWFIKVFCNGVQYRRLIYQPEPPSRRELIQDFVKAPDHWIEID